MSHVHLHSLRHTSETLALASDANIRVVSTGLGHSWTAITLDTHTYLLSGQDEALAAGVANLIIHKPAEKACQSGHQKPAPEGTGFLWYAR
jgi:integrase